MTPETSIAKIQCANPHDARCVENAIDAYLSENRRYSSGELESVRFSVIRLVEDARKLNALKGLLK